MYGKRSNPDPNREFLILLRDYCQHLQESPARLEMKRQLEFLSRSLLSKLPPLRKFTFPRIQELLIHYLRATGDTVSGLKLSGAWDALFQYAVNIASQPWRQEFSVIRLYGGYFMHNVRAVLPEAQEVFRLLGYLKSSEEGSVLEVSGVVDTERCLLVARDCLFAAMECRTVVQLLSEADPAYPNEWINVVEHYIQSGYGTPLLPLHRILDSPSLGTHDDHVNASLATMKIASFPHHTARTMPLYRSNIIGEGHQGSWCNKEAHSGYLVPHDNRNFKKVVDSVGQVCRFSTFESQRLSPSALYPSNGYHPTSCSSNQDQYSPPDGHYSRNGSQGQYRPNYGHMDIRDGEDTLGIPLMSPLLIPSPIQDPKREKVNRNLIPKQDSPVEVHSTSLARRGHSENDHDRKSKAVKRSDAVGWNCHACTYLNDEDEVICKMCSKSRVPENQELSVGGKECSACTYVNPRGRDCCSLCGESLAGCSTYT